MTQHTEEKLFPTTTFTVADPRTFDGDPYEVAERAVRQAEGVAIILDQMMDAAYKMTRNAEMERAFAHHEAPQGSDFQNSPLGRRFLRIAADVTKIKSALNGLAVAAGYNPRKPPKAT